MDNTINTSSYINNYTNYCSYRLPCGICQRTNSICPLSGGTWTPTWEVTCNTAEEVYGQHTDTAGNIHWVGTRSGEHVFKAGGEE